MSNISEVVLMVKGVVGGGDGRVVR